LHAETDHRIGSRSIPPGIQGVVGVAETSTPGIARNRHARSGQLKGGTVVPPFDCVDDGASSYRFLAVDLRAVDLRRAVDFFLAGDFLRAVDFRAVDFLRAVDFFLLAGAFRAVDFLRAVDFFLLAGAFRAVDFFLAGDFLRAVDLRAVDFLAVDFFLAGDFLRVDAAFRVPADRFAVDLFAVDFRAVLFFLRAVAMTHPLSAGQDAIRFRRRRSRSLIPPHTP
jgi:hypothetical protein